jgi:hypothetical protein
MWSRSRISTNASAFLRVAVIFSSPQLGSVTPDGWYRTFERLPDAEAAVRTVEDQMQVVGKSATEKKLARYKQAQIVTLGDFLRKRLKTVEAKEPLTVVRAL